MSDDKYRPRKHLNAVMAASSGTHSMKYVLEYMCWCSEWDRPEVTITKQQLVDHFGIHVKTVQKALSSLKNEGSIEVIHNGLGGRGNAPRYRLLIRPKGEHNTPKGEHNTPPTIDSMNPMSERPGSGRSGSGINRVGGNRSATSSKGRKFAEKQQHKKLTDAQKTEVDRFSKAIRHAGSYGPAKRLIEAWDAGDIEEPTE